MDGRAVEQVMLILAALVALVTVKNAVVKLRLEVVEVMDIMCGSLGRIESFYHPLWRTNGMYNFFECLESQFLGSALGKSERRFLAGVEENISFSPKSASLKSYISYLA